MHMMVFPDLVVYIPSAAKRIQRWWRKIQSTNLSSLPMTAARVAQVNSISSTIQNDNPTESVLSPSCLVRTTCLPRLVITEVKKVAAGINLHVSDGMVTHLVTEQCPSFCSLSREALYKFIIIHEFHIFNHNGKLFPFISSADIEPPTEASCDAVLLPPLKLLVLD